MKEQLDKILKDNNCDSLNYERALKVFNGYDFTPVMIEINKNAELFRVRTNDKKSFYKKISEISNPPINQVKCFSRANRPGQSMFYCSKFKDISLLELLDSFIEKNEVGKSQYMTYSKWKTTNDYKLLLIYNPLTQERTGFNYEFNTFFVNYLEKYSESDRKKIKDYYSIIAKYFQTPTKLNDNSIYYITSAFANFAKIQCDYDGLIYPSVQAHQAGYNIAFCDSILEKKGIVPIEVWMEQLKKTDTQKAEFQKGIINGKINDKRINWKINPAANIV
jgi:hypothetical protein